MKEDHNKIDVWQIATHLSHVLPEEMRSMLLGRIRNRDIPFLAACFSECDPSSDGITTTRTLLQIEALFKKNSSLPSATNLADNAISVFLDSEEICALTNQRLRGFLPGALNEGVSLTTSTLIWSMKHIIDSTLGPYEWFVKDIPRLLRLTSGASESSRRANSLPFTKIKKRIRCTSRAEPYVKAYGRFLGIEVRPTNVEHNRVTTVPKNWKTDRTIACEPEGNLPFQLAFDSYAKTRLKRRGQDLSCQARNQRAARKGSLTDDLATIDFSMASDTVSYELVKLLFPKEYFQFIDAVRCHKSLLPDGRIVTLEKISSMGNGTTFPIETIVFFAAAKAVGSTKVEVYGDDVIIEKDLVDPFLDLVNFLGFTVNPDKSHYSGPYRESCGHHYYNGTNITPFYLRTLVPRAPNLNLAFNSFAERGDAGTCALIFKEYVKHKAKICIVADNQDTLSGILVSADFAREHGTLRLKRNGTLGPSWIYTQKVLLPKKQRLPQRQLSDIQRLMLWYHYSSNRDPNIVYTELRSGNMDLGALVTSAYHKVSGGRRVRSQTWHEVPCGTTRRIREDTAEGVLQAYYKP